MDPRTLYGEAATLIRRELWQSREAPRRFGARHTMANELSIFRALCHEADPEDVLGAVRQMRACGNFGPAEPLSLLLLHSRNPQCRALWRECLSVHRRAEQPVAGREELLRRGLALP